MKRLKKSLSLLLCLSLLLASAIPVAAAPHHGWIMLSGEIDGNSVQGSWSAGSSQGGFADGETPKGISYDGTTNTLTLTDFEQPAVCLEAMGMGDDFTINLAGKNAIKQFIAATPHGGICSVKFAGSGSLEINKALTSSEDGFTFEPNNADSVITVTGSATVTSYASGDAKPIRIIAAKEDCIQGTYTPLLSAKEPYTYPMNSSNSQVCTGFDERYETYDSYVKDGVYYYIDVNRSTDLDGVEQIYSSIYRLFKIPDIANGYYAEYDTGMEGIATGYTATESTVDVYYPNYASPYNNKYYTTADKKMFIVTAENRYNQETSVTEYYDFEILPIEYYFSFTYSYSGEDINFYRAGEAVAAPATEEELAKTLSDGGYTEVVLTKEGLYNRYADGSVWTLKAAHTHTGTAVSAKAADCTTDGTKAYYTCSCGKAFEDAACTKEIANLDAWKVEKATGHDFGTNNEKCAKCGAANPNYKAPAPTAAPAPAENKKPIAAEDGNKVTTTNKGEATISEVKANSKKAITVSATTTVDGVEYKVTTIAANAFKNAKKATTVTLPSSIKKINANAFTGSKIKTANITVEKGASLTVNKNAFKKSSVKTIQITVPKGTTAKQKNALIKKFTKAGIKKANVKVKVKKK